MGLDLFVHCFRNKQPSFYSRSIIEEIFNRDSTSSSVPVEEAQYADGRAEIYGADDDMTTGVMLSHFSGDTVLSRILELAERTGSLIMWTAPGDWMAVTDLALLDHLPDEILQHEWPPVLTRDVKSLTHAIRGT